MSTLYELTGDYLRLLEMMSEEDVDPQVLADTMEGIDGEFEMKAESYAKIIKELESELEKFRRESERLTARKISIENNIDRLKQHLFASMKATGKLKFKTDLFSFGIQKNGGRKPMRILDDVTIPKEFCRTIPDNTKIRESLEAGNVLPFAVLEEAGEHLRIR